MKYVYFDLQRKRKVKTSTNLGKQAPTYASICVFSLRIMEG